MNTTRSASIYATFARMWFLIARATQSPFSWTKSLRQLQGPIHSPAKTPPYQAPFLDHHPRRKLAVLWDCREQTGCKANKKGVEILQLAENGSAQIAGLHRGDVISDVGGKQVRSTAELADVPGQIEPGSKVVIGYLTKTFLGWMPKETTAILAKAE